MLLLQKLGRGRYNYMCIKLYENILMIKIISGNLHRNVYIFNKCVYIFIYVYTLQRSVEAKRVSRLFDIN